MKRKLPKIKNYESFPKVNPTVDIACFNHNNTYIMLARKSDERKLRLVGGFADPKQDESYEDTAWREFKEETTGEVINIEYITSTWVDDKRFRDADDQIFTSLYYAQLLNDKNITAKDDIEWVGWIDLNTLFEEGLDAWIIRPHRSLVKAALRYVTENKSTI